MLAARRGAQDRGWVVEEAYYDAVGPDGRLIAPAKITEVDMEERVSDFMEETLSAASASTYDMGANLSQWRLVSSKLKEYCEEENGHTTETSPALATGSNMDQYVLSAENLSRISATGL